ncbi:hypothetical protein [Paenibacillus sp. 7541]|nr:hypothetical protein [Paenibacillus sp. 7541]
MDLCYTINHQLQAIARWIYDPSGMLRSELKGGLSLLDTQGPAL